MRTALLLTSEIKRTMPMSITVVQNYGEIAVFFDEGKTTVRGDHAILEGDAEDFQTWLRPFDGVYVGVGPVMAQEFKVMHIK